MKGASNEVPFFFVMADLIGHLFIIRTIFVIIAV